MLNAEITMKKRLSTLFNLSAQHENFRWNVNTVPRILKLSTKLETRYLASRTGRFIP